eukprot:1161195-Pelagomonas_calceolata.AAC.21
MASGSFESDCIFLIVEGACAVGIGLTRIRVKHTSVPCITNAKPGSLLTFLTNHLASGVSLAKFRSQAIHAEGEQPPGWARIGDCRSGRMLAVEDWAAYISSAAAKSSGLELALGAKSGSKLTCNINALHKRPCTECA